ncbi:T9SS type A sorting domain-containing protein [Dyadobacter aurulentus]|uniref:T9SS type A sorting domain-containing protein n=1 Tax=Dyadobacter sp. UC 10 TaxID=2605428 RepID=UPI0011F1FFD5|nr:T9SS type A sorting domain-containing protein [Dyadobacter sp. UC 10]KAA0991211.1 T9SS type A sorting domain-containing protein [Dyadobacter sp. UC 10]
MANCFKNFNRHLSLITVLTVTMFTGHSSIAQENVGAVLERGIGFTSNLSYPAKNSRGRVSAELGERPIPDQPASRTLVQSKLALWPNPASSETRVAVENMTEQAVGGGYTMQVHSTDGRLVQQQAWSAGQGLDVTRIPEGTYIVTVRRDDLVFSQKLIVKRQ